MVSYKYFLSPEGKAVLEDIRAFCGGYDASLYNENPMTGYRNIGKDEVLRYIEDQIHETEQNYE